MIYKKKKTTIVICNPNFRRKLQENELRCVERILDHHNGKEEAYCFLSAKRNKGWMRLPGEPGSIANYSNRWTTNLDECGLAPTLSSINRAHYRSRSVKPGELDYTDFRIYS